MKKYIKLAARILLYTYISTISGDSAQPLEQEKPVIPPPHFELCLKPSHYSSE